MACAGFMSAIPTTLVTAPVERAKVVMQVNSMHNYSIRVLTSSQVQGQGGSGPKHDGVFAVVKHLYKEGGMRSIFRGTGATLARDGPGSAA